VQYFLKYINHKRYIGLILISLLFSIGGLAQNESSPFAKKPNKKVRTKKITNPFFKQKHLFPFSPNYSTQGIYEIVPVLDVSAGYLFQYEDNVIKNTVAFSNIGYTRFGVFMSFETGWDSDYSTNTIGMTATINRFIYLWGGADLLTKNGFLTTRTLGSTRKELGIGLTPYKWIVLRGGYSGSIGITAEIGFRVIM